MIIPQFSLRWLLAVTTGAAVVFSIVGLAVRGSAWATAVSAGIGAAAVLAGVFATMFAVVWVFSVATASLGRKRDRTAGSPFGRASAAVADAATPDAAEVPATPVLIDDSPAPPKPS